jgi:hypothetical protein
VLEATMHSAVPGRYRMHNSHEVAF